MRGYGMFEIKRIAGLLFAVMSAILLISRIMGSVQESWGRFS